MTDGDQREALRRIEDAIEALDRSMRAGFADLAERIDRNAADARWRERLEARLKDHATELNGVREHIRRLREHLRL